MLNYTTQHKCINLSTQLMHNTKDITQVQGCNMEVDIEDHQSTKLSALIKNSSLLLTATNSNLKRPQSSSTLNEHNYNNKPSKIRTQ
jgi:hypothetical protein